MEEEGGRGGWRNAEKESLKQQQTERNERKGKDKCVKETWVEVRFEAVLEKK